MNKKIRNIACLLTLLTTLIATASNNFKDNYYKGNVIVDTIDVQIFINTEAEVIAEYKLINTGDAEESVEIELIKPSTTLYVNGELLKNPITFSPQEQKNITLSYDGEIEGESLKRFTFSPQILINSKRSVKHTNNYCVDLLLPEGIPSLIGSSETYSNKIITNEDRSLYQWEYHNIYPTTISFMWSDLGVNFEVEKSVTPQDITEPNQIITIQIVFKNLSDEEFHQVSLVDDFDPSEFESVQPIDGFTITDEEASDPRLIWRKDIEKLGAQEVLSFEYSIKYIGDTSMIYDFKLAPVKILIDSQLAAASNDVTLRKMVRVTKVGVIQAEIAEKTDYLKIGLIIAVIVAFIIAFIVIVVLIVVLIRNPRK